MKRDGRFGARLTNGFAICVAGGLLAACSGSSSGFNDPVEDMLGDPLVAMGLKVDPSEETIEYGPRSPLVMPSADQAARDLPPPVAASESYGAEWPTDPDAERRRKEAEMRQAALKEKPRDVEYASEPMTPGELEEWGRMYGRSNGSGVALGPKKPGGKEVAKTVSPRELLDRRKDPNQPLRSEPPRQSLNEPPAGYRTPAPSVEGTGEPEKKGFFSRLWGNS
ncbi:hypothetical protein [Microbaculum sp. FT89]|uniref:hypothetical protein n=1 Tax=Microbaculum sp. FT89 TaxID=3447298 RepID=UPI003F53542E